MVKIIKSESNTGTVEKYKGGFDKMSESIKGKPKRNLIILGAVALIAGAIFLNWILFSNSADPYVPNNPTGNITEAPGNEVSVPDNNDSYFAMAQLNRETAYDTAYNTLISVTTSANATEEAKDAAFREITTLASNKQREANIETLIKAKGFEECVAVISDEHIDVVVKSSGLEPGQRAQIQEIVLKQASIAPSNITIIEKNS